MGIEHERIHLETSSVLIRQLPLEQVRPRSGLADLPRARRRARRTRCSRSRRAASARQGPRTTRSTAGTTSTARHEADVPALPRRPLPGLQRRVPATSSRTAATPTAALVDGGGLALAELPRAEASALLGAGRRRRLAPALMLEEIPMPWDWPVEVNYLEAKAFCNWKARRTGRPIRLPTEEEWYRLLDVSRHSRPAGLGARRRATSTSSSYASSCPVTSFAIGGFFDVIGNVWQWTETPITGFPGFAVHPLYDDFSTPTFDTQHNLIKGGSWISTGNEATRHARYAFRRHFFQHAGFRYVESRAPGARPHRRLRDRRLGRQYCEFHYGAEYFGVPNFPAAAGRDLPRAEPPGGAPRARSTSAAPPAARPSSWRRTSTTSPASTSRRASSASAHELQEKGYIRYAIRRRGRARLLPRATLAEFDLDGGARAGGVLAGRRLQPQAAVHRLRSGPRRAT